MPSKAAKTPQRVLRARLWIEIDRAAALTDAGADLLEQIEACSSLSEAARRLRFSYRRAWMLADAMNKRWPRPLVVTTTGGKHGGGSRLTDLGRDVLHGYRDVQVELDLVLNRARSLFEKLG